MVFEIRAAQVMDHSAIWEILRPVFRAGDTYSIDPEISRKDALTYWCGAEHQTFVIHDGAEVLGTYYLRRNQGGGGAHVCNCGYITHAAAQGRGIARKMLTHSLETARQIGYRAMQYNFVLATNTRAVATWERAGFNIVGRLPGAFLHPEQGYVDALVMYLDLTKVASKGYFSEL